VRAIIAKIRGLTLKLMDTESISLRMFRIFFAFIMAGAVVFTALAVYSEATRVRDDLINKSRTLTALLADNVRIGVFAESREQLNEAISGVMGQPETMAVSVFSSDGRELIKKVKPEYASSGAVVQYSASREPVSSIVTLDGWIEIVEPVILESAAGSEESIFFSESAAAGRGRVIGSVRVLFDTSSITERTISILIRNIAIGCLLLLIGAMMLFYALESSLRPLKQLTYEVKLLGEGKEIEKISIESKDEIGSLAVAFNEMADNLKKREQEARDLEQRLRHAEKMEAVGTLARGIAHDFNNILTTIEGSMFALRKKIDRENPMSKYLYHMDNSVSRARVLIQGLLVFSRGQAQRRMPVEINSTIGNLMPMISTVLGDHIECSQRIFRSPLVITADGFQIEQALMNLAVNARDAMPDGGTLTISSDLKMVDVDDAEAAVLPAPGWYAVVSVRDSGGGITEDVKERIFEPFYTTKDVGRGSGLGLSIVYGIIEEHEGAIFVFSEEGMGAEFRIYLPIFEKE
jgi:signal transduction histidine kinase